MAVRLISEARHYVGLAGDTKPASAGAGSTFTETDTGEVYVADSASAWTSVVYRAGQNVEATALAVDEETVATRNSADITNYGARTLRIVVVTTDKIGTTATYTPFVSWKYDGTAYSPIWTAAAALTNDGTVHYDLGPGIIDTGVAVEGVDLSIPRTLRIGLTIGGTANASHNMDTSVFYSLGL